MFQIKIHQPKVNELSLCEDDLKSPIFLNVPSGFVFSSLLKLMKKKGMEKKLSYSHYNNDE